jgi:hypothetical protein
MAASRLAFSLILSRANVKTLPFGFKAKTRHFTTICRLKSCSLTDLRTEYQGSRLGSL